MEYVDWRLIFFINVPVGIVGTIAALVVLPHFGPTAVGRFDVLGLPRHRDRPVQRCCWR